jgi:hypothetical protein
MDADSRAGRRPPAHRLRPVVWGSLAVLATYTGFQLLVAESAAGSLWWRNEWLRRSLQARFPTVSFGPAQPVPSWQTWLPSAVTSVVLVGALAALALALVCAGRGCWLFLASALPLVPARVAPGVWLPAVPDQVMYSIVRPAGATEPSVTWSWLSAGVEALVIALPALALSAVVVERRPVLFSADVVRRLVPVMLAVVAVVAWNWRAGEPQDWVQHGHRMVWMLVGALLLAGGLRRRWALPILVALPALAAGLLRWTSGVDGPPQVVLDPAASAASAAAVLGGGWIVVSPLVVRVLRWPLSRWRAMVIADVERRSVPRSTAPAERSAGAADRRSRRAGPDGPDRPGASDGPGATGLPAGPVSRRAPAAPAGAGGRHRG